ncbi:MAG: acyl-CoA dehydrogenase family protein [Deltaproteobacteria bacterium]|nr:acyl-CoA dehydrogenase family protein [Deltaproteobacteria bacterium]
MAWDFQTEPEFQQKLDWMQHFVREEIEPIDVLFPGGAAPYDVKNPETRKLVAPLQAEVKKQGLWACHLGPELGGLGYGQLKLALMNEILGRSTWAPSIFGTQAPDSGNAEILAHYGSEEQKRRYLDPLLAGEIVSSFSMTEPQAGSDPGEFRCRAIKQGSEWVIRGEKYFSSNSVLAEFLIVMVITDPDVPVHQGASMFLVPKDAPGVHFVRRSGLGIEPLGEGVHGYIRYEDVRVPEENLLGEPGQAFHIAQTRLSGGRIHHAMRTLGQVKRAFDMMCERSLSRRTQGEPLSRKQSVQNVIADSFIEIEQFRLLVLYTAWLIDQGDKRRARTYVSAIKVRTPAIMQDVVGRALHVHGALGCSNEMPLAHMWMTAPVMGIVDGPTEVHRVQVARDVLRDYKPSEGLWPDEYLPHRVDAAREKFAEVLEAHVGNL